MWVYVKSEPRLWTVGFYAPDGTWHTDSDHEFQDAAADRCAYLNGSSTRGEDQYGSLRHAIERAFAELRRDLRISGDV